MAGVKNGNLDNYLREHKTPAGEEFTHTRIGDKNLNIYAGSYKIGDTPDKWKEFMECYYQHVIVKGNLEYLTEKQLVSDGPILLDFDFHYANTVTTRQHSKEHIVDGVMQYADTIAQLVNVSDGAKIDVFVMEKNDVNKLENKTKDGIHIIIGIKMHKAVQVILRQKVMPELQNMWSDLPVINTWNDILDEGVTKGQCPWQLYGSRKPGNQAYMIKHHFELIYTDGSWTIEEYPIASFSTVKNIYKLSARYTEYPEFQLKDHLKTEFDTAKASLSIKGSGTGAGGIGAVPNAKYKLKIKTKGSSAAKADAYADITDEEMLDNMLAALFEDIASNDYILKETHDYTMSLPATYYGPSSYTKWVKVGMALCNTSNDLFLTWLKFSCQENGRDTLKGTNGKFDWRSVPELYETWRGFVNNNPDGLTHRSVMYWSKTDAREKYDEIRNNTVEFFINQTISAPTPTEFDLASVLKAMYKGQYICSGIKHTVWYEFINHRWHEIDSGFTLQMAISTKIHKMFNDKVTAINSLVATMDPGDPKRKELMTTSQRISDITTMLKRTQPKKNIMHEAGLLFYDKEFYVKLDKNPYLLCFKNGVVDFNQKIFRKGQPDDYLSKCTNIDYIPYNPIKSVGVVDEINAFMKQIFPLPELENYMWEHLASCLIGINANQTFHVYKGSGANGKSVITDLMTKCMGTYKGNVPITLVTTKRNAIGGTSSEVAQLDGVRYAVMQEPSKGDKINEGVLKELTGGTDPIQARALFKESFTFVPQFKLVVCTNNDFENTSTDDGTVRRFRYVPYLSKFIDNPYEDEIKYPRSKCPYQFKKNLKLSERYELWAPVFMSMLVKISYEKLGVVKDCQTVMKNSEEHLEKQDSLTGFVKSNLRAKEGSVVKKTNLLESFKVWYTANFGQKDMPKGKELTEFMNVRFGIYKGGWHNIEIVYEEEDPLEDC